MLWLVPPDEVDAEACYYESLKLFIIDCKVELTALTEPLVGDGFWRTLIKLLYCWPEVLVAGTTEALLLLADLAETICCWEFMLMFALFVLA